MSRKPGLIVCLLTVLSCGSVDQPTSSLPSRAVEQEATSRFGFELQLPIEYLEDGWKVTAWEPAEGEWDRYRSLEERKDVEIRKGLRDGILGDSPEMKAKSIASESSVEFDYVFAANHLLNAVPNPWRGAELLRKVHTALLKKNEPKRITDNFVFILEELRKRIESERDRLARQIFNELLENGSMRFMVVAQELGLNRLPRETLIPSRKKRANREDGNQFELSLFEFVSEGELNSLENQVATYLDKQERLYFWYRNPVRHGYYVQGWKRNRIFADFIFAQRQDENVTSKPFNQVFVAETKGMHLKKAADTAYKRSVFGICNDHAKRRNWAEFFPAMRDKVVKFEVVDEEEWEKRLNTLVDGALAE